MKLISEWLQEAKEQGYPWADTAISLCTNGDYEAFSIHDALLSAFTFPGYGPGDSEFDYWWEIYTYLKGKNI